MASAPISGSDSSPPFPMEVEETSDLSVIKKHYNNVRFDLAKEVFENHTEKFGIIDATSNLLTLSGDIVDWFFQCFPSNQERPIDKEGNTVCHAFAFLNQLNSSTLEILKKAGFSLTQLNKEEKDPLQVVLAQGNYPAAIALIQVVSENDLKKEFVQYFDTIILGKARHLSEENQASLENFMKELLLKFTPTPENIGSCVECILEKAIQGDDINKLVGIINTTSAAMSKEEMPVELESAFIQLIKDEIQSEKNRIEASNDFSFQVQKQRLLLFENALEF